MKLETDKSFSGHVRLHKELLENEKVGEEINIEQLKADGYS
ncbi:hypothetical protein ACQCVP_06345 [Rossellomorea vietnamensis]